MGAHERLHAARLLAHQGRHEEALREYVWFHAHAIEEDPALGAVRQSFALGYWAELARDYPPARQALEDVREQHVAALRATHGRTAFSDIAAINKWLGAEEHTHALFVELAGSDPETAQACAHMAMDALIKAADFALAARFMPDPERIVREASAGLNWDVAIRRRRPFSTAPRIKAHIHNYAQEIKRVIAVLEGRGRRPEAQRIAALAADLIPATTIRRAVRAALLPDARPWYSPGRFYRYRSKERLRWRRSVAKGT